MTADSNYEIHYRFVCILLAVLMSPFSVAQKVAQFPCDTSFTVYSAYQKEVKKFPEIRIARLAEFDQMRWKKDVVYYTIKNSKFGKRELHVDVLNPKDFSQKHPAVLMLHGGGWSSGSKSHMIPMAQRFVDNGYVAIPVEYRLSDEAVFPAAVIDVKNAIRWVRSHHHELNIDTARIALFGCSAGAQLAGLVAVTSDVRELDAGKNKISTKVKAVVSFDGIVSFIHPEASEEGRAAAKWLGGPRKTATANWRKASTLEYVDKQTPPFGFVNSSIPRFHAGRDDMTKKLEEFGIYYEVHTIPDTPHPFWLFYPWIDPAFEYALNFLNKVFGKQ